MFVSHRDRNRKRGNRKCEVGFGGFVVSLAMKRLKGMPMRAIPKARRIVAVGSGDAVYGGWLG
jgi:hypothetical protein